MEYFVAIANCDKCYIDIGEDYHKQSYRSRCNILSSNGILSLSIPIKRGGTANSHKVPISEIEIDYSKPWVHNHKIALLSGYKSSPFYDYYAPELFSIFDKKVTTLLELNNLLTLRILELCGVVNNIEFLTIEKGKKLGGANVEERKKELDLRSQIQPKFKGESFLKESKMEKPYWQLFAKQGFIPNLSIVDLLFNEGPNSLTFLQID